MVAISGQRGACDGIPDLSSFIIADGDDALSIRRPRHARYDASVLEIGSHISAAHGIPEMHSIVSPRRDDLPTIGRPRHRVHGTMMPFIRNLLLPYACIKYIDF